MSLYKTGRVTWGRVPVAYPAVLASGVDLHVAAVVGILQQAVVLEEQPGAFAQPLALVVVVLLEELLHQLQQAFWIPRVPPDQVLRKRPETDIETGASAICWNIVEKVHGSRTCSPNSLAYMVDTGPSLKG
ncbi:hypothetical protein EYF80_042150 [Liparis tanakae]|uniref:Uncharacterized protein n=1 Tax=Liparis tanakae TaxID=230148 RepID=A0A4Z2G3E5_9TELE|nr:hypothetical protein EYF80_042150 [Liparis tanakae]